MKTTNQISIIKNLQCNLKDNFQDVVHGHVNVLDTPLADYLFCSFKKNQCLHLQLNCSCAKWSSFHFRVARSNYMYSMLINDGDWLMCVRYLLLLQLECYFMAVSPACTVMLNHSHSRLLRERRLHAIMSESNKM